MGSGQRLTALEASFLALERPGLPMHVAGVVIFDASSHVGGPLTMMDLRHHVASRLRRLPKYRQLLQFSPLGLDRPEWVRASNLKLGDHLFHHRLGAPGSREQLADLCARIHARLLPRDRPLWEMHLIDGLGNGNQALIVKTHHAITDGIAGIEVGKVLFDKAPNVHAFVRPELRFAEGQKASVLAPLQAALGVAFTVAGGPIASMGPFNGPVGDHRNFGMATLRMDDIRRIKERLGGSVDDVLLAVVAAGLSQFLRQQRYPDELRALRAMLPVSTWPSSASPNLGNHVTAIFVDLPVQAADPAALVRTIAATKSVLRSAHAAAGTSMLIEAAGLLPHPLHEAVVRFAGGLMSANLVLSDVPGPDEPLFMMGRRITACYPMIPLPPTVGLSIAAVSIGGVMSVGVVADPDLLPNPQQLANAIERAVKQFERSCAARRPSRSARQRTRRAA
jgi:diacylglycerol O-acyltransferase / wax synthase